MKIDKSTWIPTTLADVAYWYQKDIPNSQQSVAGIDYYLTADHIDSDAVTIKRFSHLSDGQKGPTITKHFEKGDLLFSTRSTALHKAAIAPVVGVTGEKLLVIRVKPKSALLAELLPFVMQSAHFWDYAINSAAGSVNKFTSWTKIRDYQFLLPPLDMQARLAKLLWAADEVGERNSDLIEASVQTSATVFDKVYHNIGCRYVKLGECLEYTQYGTSDQISEVGEIPVLRMNNLQNGKLDYSDLKYINRKAVEKKLLLEKGDILFNRTNSFELVGKVALFESAEEVSFASYLIKLKVNTSIIDPAYLNIFLNSSKGQSAIRIHRTPGVSQSNINPENLKKILVPIIPLEEQSKIISQISKISSSAELAVNGLKASKRIVQQLTNQIFSV